MDRSWSEEGFNRMLGQSLEGKGGKIRTLPINEPIAIFLREQLSHTPRGHKLLVPDEMDTDYAMYRLQQFIRNHREEIQDPDSDRPMTFHGLRHTCAAETYTQLIRQGKSPLDARFEVSRLLGHERAELMPILNIGRNTAYELVRSGSIRSIRVGKF